MSVRVYNFGGSVVAGLVPATSPWYGIFPLFCGIGLSAV